MAKRISKAEYKLAEDADLETLQALMQESLGQAQSQRKVRDEGQGVIRKAGKKTVVFVNNFSGYLQAYSGIVEALRAVDGQYGGLAYSTLSVFLIVRKPVLKTSNLLTWTGRREQKQKGRTY